MSVAASRARPAGTSTRNRAGSSRLAPSAQSCSRRSSSRSKRCWKPASKTSVEAPTNVSSRTEAESGAQDRAWTRSTAGQASGSQSTAASKAESAGASAKEQPPGYEPAAQRRRQRHHSPSIRGTGGRNNIIPRCLESRIAPQELPGPAEIVEGPAIAVSRRRRAARGLARGPHRVPYRPWQSGGGT